jgi:hypothetical protein
MLPNTRRIQYGGYKRVDVLRPLDTKFTYEFNLRVSNLEIENVFNYIF